MSSSQRTFNVLYIAISMLLDMSAIFLNGLLAYLIKKLKKTSFIPFWFIYCLSACDIMVGITGFVFHLSLPKWSLDSGEPLWSSTAAFAYKFHHYFMQTSGQLTIIIAFDRYVNMRFLEKYSKLMTKAKARCIIVFCILFGIAFTIPAYTLAEEYRSSYELSINAIRAIATFLIYVVYIKTYITIRSRYSALETGKRNQIAPSHTPNKTRDYQGQMSNAQRCSVSLEAKLGVVYDPLEANTRPLPCGSGKRALFLPPQNKSSILPQCSQSSPNNVTSNGINPDDPKTRASVPIFVNNDSTNRGTDLNVEGCKATKVKEVTRTKGQGAQVNQKLHARMPTPEQYFLNAVLFIFLALFMCYLPFFFYMLYMHATNDRSAILESISLTAVLLNSSLNAVILIAFNKDMQKCVKNFLSKR